jgi:cGMP-dependent 3',5'-cyclic phosphodiesterase
MPVVHEAIRAELLRSVSEAARVLLHARATSVALLNETGDELVFVAAAGEAADEITGCRISSHHGLAGVVAQDGEPLEIRDLMRDPRFSHDVATETGYEPDAMTLVPVRDGARIVGVLSVLDPADEPTDANRAALAALAEHAVSALDLSVALERTLAH